MFYNKRLIFLCCIFHCFSRFWWILKQRKKHSPVILGDRCFFMIINDRLCLFSDTLTNKFALIKPTITTCTFKQGSSDTIQPEFELLAFLSFNRHENFPLSVAVALLLSNQPRRDSGSPLSASDLAPLASL